MNNRIALLAQSFAEELPAEFVCECTDERCFAVVPLTPEEWRAGTCEAGYYIIRPGHEMGEEVVIAGEQYALVRDATGQTSSERGALGG